MRATTLRSTHAHARSPWGWALTGSGLGLLLSLVMFAPARWLAGLVQMASQERVIVLAPRGSFWNGSGQLVLSGGPDSADRTTLPGAVGWHIRPSWRGVSLALNAECCTASPLQLSAEPIGWSGVRIKLSDGQSSWPAGLLTGLGTPWNTVQVQGQLMASTTGFELQWVQNRVSLAGRVQLDATQVSSRLSTLQPMGSYRLTLQGGPSTTLQLETLTGSLQLSGQGQWVSQRLHFNGVASAEPDSVEALSNLLNIIGRRNGARSIIKVG